MYSLHFWLICCRNCDAEVQEMLRSGPGIKCGRSIGVFNLCFEHWRSQWRNTQTEQKLFPFNRRQIMWNWPLAFFFLWSWSLAIDEWGREGGKGYDSYTNVLEYGCELFNKIFPLFFPWGLQNKRIPGKYKRKPPRTHNRLQGSSLLLSYWILPQGFWAKRESVCLSVRLSVICGWCLWNTKTFDQILCRLLLLGVFF